MLTASMLFVIIPRIICVIYRTFYPIHPCYKNGWKKCIKTFLKTFYYEKVSIVLYSSELKIAKADQLTAKSQNKLIASENTYRQTDTKPSENKISFFYKIEEKYTTISAVPWNIKIAKEAFGKKWKNSEMVERVLSVLSRFVRRRNERSVLALIFFSFRFFQRNDFLPLTRPDF